MDINPATSDVPLTQLDLQRTNQLLSGKDPQAIIDWTIMHARKPVITTNFRPLSFALVHLVTRIKTDIPVLWVDSGYNTAATYQFVEEVTRRFSLNLHVYTPRLTSTRYAAIHGEIPQVGSEEHRQFTQTFKLEPFERAFGEWQPDFWLTGIRADQTEYRRSLEVVSKGAHGSTRVAPILSWTEVDLEGYAYANDLPDYDDYFDPVKGERDRECGIQTLD